MINEKNLVHQLFDKQRKKNIYEKVLKIDIKISNLKKNKKIIALIPT